MDFAGSIMPSIRRLRHELKVCCLSGWPYIRNRFVRRLPELSRWPADPAAPGGMEVHILTSTRDHVLAIWAAVSYYAFSGRSDELVIHEYDHLSASTIARIKRYFPACRILRRRDADPVVADGLARFPLLLQLRRRLPMMVKLTDPVLLGRRGAVILLDSDVLFFRNPLELSGRSSAQHLFSRDVASVYSVRREEAARAGFPVPPRVCAGIARVNRGTVDFSYMERFLGSGLVSITDCTLYIEQTLWALECGRAGFEYLPDTYTIRLAGERPDAVAQHYVGPIRHLFFTEGLPRVARVLASQI